MPSQTGPQSDSGIASRPAAPGGEHGRAAAALTVFVTALAASYVSIYTTLGPIGPGQNPATIQREILVYIFSVGVLVAVGTSLLLSLRRVLEPDREFSLLEFLLSSTLIVIVPLLFIFSVLVGLLVATMWFGPSRALGIPLTSVVGSRFTYALITFLMVASGMGWGITMGSVRFANS